MLRPRPPTRPAVTSTRAINASDVDRAADCLLREGQRPTIQKVRAKIGRGSPNTVNPLLDQWWQRLAGRLDAGPAALHRLPEPVLLAAEGLWMQALDEARKRATLELGSRKTALSRDRQDLELRSHVLSIREGELNARLEASERRVTALETELESLTTLLRKEQASRPAAERRQAKPTASRTRARAGGRATQPTTARATSARTANSKAPARRSRSTAAAPKRSTTARPRQRSTTPRKRR